MHHVDVHVTSVPRSRKLLDAFMPVVRYAVRHEETDFVSYWRNETRPAIGFIEDGTPVRASAMRIAFAVAQETDVDAAARAAVEAGARNVEGPGFHPEYGDDYYAVFFEDLDGNKFEVVRDAAAAQ
jgi:catechol 2,3-dioxygenase-like lactoylglutathione lyase family enzyme